MAFKGEGYPKLLMTELGRVRSGANYMYRTGQNFAVLYSFMLRNRQLQRTPERCRERLTTYTLENEVQKANLRRVTAPPLLSLWIVPYMSQELMTFHTPLHKRTTCVHLPLRASEILQGAP